MCEERTRFIESRATVMARRGRRGANELATLRHILEKRDELGEKREYNWGLNTVSFKVGFYVGQVGENHQPTTPRVTHMIV